MKIRTDLVKSRPTCSNVAVNTVFRQWWCRLSYLKANERYERISSRHLLGLLCALVFVGDKIRSLHADLEWRHVQPIGRWVSRTLTCMVKAINLYYTVAIFYLNTFYLCLVSTCAGELMACGQFIAYHLVKEGSRQLGAVHKVHHAILDQFLLPLPVTLCHTPRDPPKIRPTSRTPPIVSSTCIHT